MPLGSLLDIREDLSPCLSAGLALSLAHETGPFRRAVVIQGRIPLGQEDTDGCGIHTVLVTRRHGHDGGQPFDAFAVVREALAIGVKDGFG
ncbi:MAG: hypothetical protein AB7Q16_24005 [Vicinamibacterales bacterium]